MTFLIAFLLMVLIVVGMGLGVLLGRRPISGSCGGLGALGLKADCEICRGNRDLCKPSKG